MTLKMCVDRLDFVVGNAQKVGEAAKTARGERLMLTPELSNGGYAAEDLFLRSGFIQACDDAVKSDARAPAGLNDMAVVVGRRTGRAKACRIAGVRRLKPRTDR